MENKTILRYKTNERVLALLYLLDEIAWEEIRPNSIHRIFYLAKIMYLFVHEDEINILNEYSFSTAAAGPFSAVIKSSITDLLARKDIINDRAGNIILNRKVPSEFLNNQFVDWIKVIIYILGVYGEDKIYGFTARDATYIDAITRKSIRTLDSSNDNKTIEFLNEFKKAFEDTLDDTSEISRKEYLELYFEYVFGQIIKEKLK